MSDNLTCRELVELITDYIEGALPPDDHSRLDAHLQMCAPCDYYLDQVRVTIRLTGRLSEETIPDPVPDRLLEAFRAWKQERS